MPGNCVVYGDLHGDRESYNNIRTMTGHEPSKVDTGYILELLDEFKACNKKTNKMEFREELPDSIYLGDYTDRGIYPEYIICSVVEDYLENSDGIVLLRGNHDDGKWDYRSNRISIDIGDHYFTLPRQLKEKYGIIEGNAVMKSIALNFWAKLPYSLLVEDKYWFVHGGVPVGYCDYGTYARNGNIENPGEDEIMEMLWNDPIAGEINTSNGRGSNVHRFGYLASEQILKSLGAKTIIRSHEPFKVLQSEHGGRVLTIGSCPNAYSMTEGAFLLLDKENESMNADEIIKTSGKRFLVEESRSF